MAGTSLDADFILNSFSIVCNEKHMEVEKGEGARELELFLKAEAVPAGNSYPCTPC
jgi:hypothetical protein